MMIRLLIADDERLEREALAEMVTRRFVEHEIVLEEPRLWSMRWVGRPPKRAARLLIPPSCGERTSF